MPRVIVDDGGYDESDGSENVVNLKLAKMRLSKLGKMMLKKIQSGFYEYVIEGMQLDEHEGSLKTFFESR